MNNSFNDADFIDDDTINDDFDMLDDSSSVNDNSFDMVDDTAATNIFNQNGIDMQNVNYSQTQPNADYINYGTSYQPNTYTNYQETNTYRQPSNYSNSYNGDSTSVLASMYDDKASTSYEEELKTAKPFINPTEVKTIEEAPKEVTYSNDFMDYDPMLHNELVTDGNYTITQYDSSKESDYVPEQTNFDSEGMMEYYSNENVVQEKPKEEEQPVVETYNTNGMMYYQTPGTNTASNTGDTSTQASSNSSGLIDEPMEKVPRFINNDIEVDNVIPADGDIPEDRGSIAIYNKKENYEKSQTRKAAELVFTVIVISLLILLVSFFPDINNFFTNLRN